MTNSRYPDRMPSSAEDSLDAEVAGVDAAMSRARRHAERTAELHLDAAGGAHERPVARMQMINDKFADRFRELQSELDTMPKKSDDLLGYVMETGAWAKWVTSTTSLLQTVCGTDSAYYENFVASRSRTYLGYREEAEKLGGIFRSAKEAFEGGYLFDIARDVTGEVVSDFVVRAKHALDKGDNKDVAAVLASAALEDALKRLAHLNGLSVSNESMGKVVEALRSQGIVSRTEGAMLGGMVPMRNSAMHARWKEFDRAAVTTFIGSVEQFLLAHFGS